MICFALHAFDEPEEQVARTASRLAEVYPGAEVFLVEDGGNTYDHVQCSQRFRGDHLKTKESGGAWTHRYLGLYLLNSVAPYLVKVDPDTEVLKEATDFPQGEAVFSAVFAHDLGFGKTWRMPHGGALGFTRAMALRLHSSKALLHPRFKDSPRYYDFNDIMLGQVIREERLNLVERTDFACGKTKVVTVESTFAHTH